MSEKTVVRIVLSGQGGELNSSTVSYLPEEEEEKLDGAVDDLIAGHLWQPGDSLTITEIDWTEQDEDDDSPASSVEPIKPGSMPKVRL